MEWRDWRMLWTDRYLSIFQQWPADFLVFILSDSLQNMLACRDKGQGRAAQFYPDQTHLGQRWDINCQMKTMIKTRSQIPVACDCMDGNEIVTLLVDGGRVKVLKLR
jgi:hypothetical protein